MSNGYWNGGNGAITGIQVQFFERQHHQRRDQDLRHEVTTTHTHKHTHTNKQKGVHARLSCKKGVHARLLRKTTKQAHGIAPAFTP